MSDRDTSVDKLGGIEGVDEAALGTDAPPESAPPGAEVVDDERRVPGAGAENVHPDESKPWFTSLAAASDQAGVGNDAVDDQEDEFPFDPELGR